MKLRYFSKHMFDLLTKRAKVLSSRTRLVIWYSVAELAGHPSDLARTLNLAESTVSHHLRVLEDAGLVRHTQQGRYRWYESTGVRWGVVSEDEIASDVS